MVWIKIGRNERIIRTLTVGPQQFNNIFKDKYINLKKSHAALERFDHLELVAVRPAVVRGSYGRGRLASPRVAYTGNVGVAVQRVGAAVQGGEPWNYRLRGRRSSRAST